MAVFLYCMIVWVLVGVAAFVLAVEAERAIIGEVPAGSWTMFLACIAAGPFCFAYVAWTAWKMYHEPRRPLDLGPDADKGER